MLHGCHYYLPHTSNEGTFLRMGLDSSLGAILVLRKSLLIIVNELSHLTHLDICKSWQHEKCHMIADQTKVLHDKRHRETNSTSHQGIGLRNTIVSGLETLGSLVTKAHSRPETSLVRLQKMMKWRK
jgi:hypothetical protein